MPNNYFQFKQFLIKQGDTAMKVTTDACIFGAWVVKYSSAPGYILDIGAGTGLLSLMLAQHFKLARIDAVEIDTDAYNQCLDNFSNSPWSSRLDAHKGRIQDYTTRKKYDLIVSNPPFFTGSLKGNSRARNQAFHDNDLSQQDLLKCASELVSPSGYLYVLYPEAESDKFLASAESFGLYPSKILRLRDTEESKVLRVILGLSAQEREIAGKELIIKSQSGNYTHEFTELLSPYYLHL